MTRYSAQEIIIGKDGQEKLSKSSVTIVGIGALGTVAAELLVRSGIGKITLIDHDIVDLSNLQRQTLYDEQDIGKPKVSVAQEKLKKINSSTKITSHISHLEKENAKLINADIVIDCTDNMETRFIINDYCKANSIPWIHAAAAGTIGVVLPILNSYCFACIFNNTQSSMTCGDAGILNTTSFMTASIQVTEALKILTNQKPTEALIRCNIWDHSTKIISIKRNQNCAICNNTMAKTKEKEEKMDEQNAKPFTFTLARCTTRAAYSAKPNKNIKLDLKKIKRSFKTLIDTPIALVIKEENMEIIIHNYGELIFKSTSTSEEKKMQAIAEKIYEVGQ